MGGLISIPINDEENNWLYKSTKDRAGHCSGYLGTNYLWLGAHDNIKEGRWDKWETGRTVEYQGLWRGAGPNGGTVENCMVMLYGAFAGRWSDIACLETYSFCVPCEFERYTTMHLKGALLCSTSYFNSEYLLIHEINGRISLTGYLHSDIIWSNDTASWVLQSKKVSRFQ